MLRKIKDSNFKHDCTMQIDCLFFSLQPDFALFLGRAAVEALGSLGFQWSPRMARGEAWAGVAITGVGVVAEGATTLQEGVYLATSFHLTAVTQLRDDGETHWRS